MKQFTNYILDWILTLEFICIAFVVTLLVVVITQSVRQNHKRYEAWVKITGNAHNLTYDEWYVAKDMFILNTPIERK